MKAKYISILAITTLVFTACNNDEEENDDNPQLNIPTEYISPDYDLNVTAENAVIADLLSIASACNNAEANAGSGSVNPIDYPTALSEVTLGSYRSEVEDWLVQLVAAANSPTPFINPGSGMPSPGEDGGLLGSRLLDENGLELEQMVEKGSFGAALYNHALSVINGTLTSASTDKLIEIFGATPEFSATDVTASANYAKRRSDVTGGSGYLYDIRDNLIAAKAAIEGGNAFNDRRDQELSAFLRNWEESNFATVIYYCNTTKNGLQEAAGMPEGPDRDAVLGNTMHAYAEGVGFTAGFKGLETKFISDNEIDGILEQLLAPFGQSPESYRFLNEASLISNLDNIIEDIQEIYGFTDEEVAGFFVNN